VDLGPNVAGSYDVISLQAGANFCSAYSVTHERTRRLGVACKVGRTRGFTQPRQRSHRPSAGGLLSEAFPDGPTGYEAIELAGLCDYQRMPVDTPSMRELDGYSPEWENNASAWPSLVTAGMDFVAPCPTQTDPPKPLGVSLVLVGNAPIPFYDTDFCANQPRRV